MNLEGIRIGFAITGSFCTLDKIKTQIKNLVDQGAEVIPILSFHTCEMDTRFGLSEKFRKDVEEIAGHTCIDSIQAAEPIGPKGIIDILVIAPCTGNTIAKLANGITDTPVLMAAKAHLRNNKPVVICVSTNDGLGVNFQNIGKLMAMKHIFFVPFGQDDPKKKPNSVVSCLSMIPLTVLEALEEKQIQPVLI